MRRSGRLLMLCASMVGLAARAHAQNRIPVRTLTTAVHTDSGLLATASSVRPLADGRVLVNDASHRRVLLFDATLAHFTVVLDSGTTGVNRYAVQPMSLIPYLGDSTVLYDFAAGAFVVANPNGTIARTMASPRQNDRLMLVLYPAAYDLKGSLIIRTNRSRPPNPAMPASRTDSGKTKVEIVYDSMAILRIDPDTKLADTLGLIAIPTTKRVILSFGEVTSTGSGIDPFPTPDEWTLLSDGTVAIVRGRDYHIDWIHLDGTKTSTPKMAFDWKRIPDEEKQRMSDSLRNAAEALNAAPPAAPAAGGGPSRPIPKTPPVWFEPKEMSDYYPPIRVNTVKSDPEGNVWVLPTTSMLAGNGLVYDLVNRKGEVFERVQLSPNRTLVAVGKGGVVYMSYTPARGVAYLERATIIR